MLELLAALCVGSPPNPQVPRGASFKLPGLLKLTNTEPFAAWFVVTGDATADGISVVRSVLGAISSRSNGVECSVYRVWV